MYSIASQSASKDVIANLISVVAVSYIFSTNGMLYIFLFKRKETIYDKRSIVNPLGAYLAPSLEINLSGEALLHASQ